MSGSLSAPPDLPPCGRPPEGVKETRERPSVSLRGRPGSALWLIHHELRLAWRGIGGKGIKLLLVLLLMLGIALHVGAYGLVAKWPQGEAPAWVLFALGGAAWVVVSLMLSQAILQSVTALFDRGDLDLLLASPLPTRSVFIARGLGIAISVVGLYLFLLAPLAHVGLFTGHANLLAIYPTLLSLALGVTALGIWLTLLLVRWLGARRARTVAQVMGSLVGAAMFLTSQAHNLLGEAQRQHWNAKLMSWLAPGGPLSEDSPVWLPARALRGELLPLLAVVLVGAGSFWAVVNLAHQRFLAGTQESVSGSAQRGAAAPRAGSTRFKGGLFRTVLSKEWRLLLRDPQLITQTLLQVLYLIPALAIALRGDGRMAFMLVPAVVWLAASLAGGMVWITVAAEEAPELLGTAPASLTRLRWYKLLAALLPVWLLVSPMLVYVAGQGLLISLIFLVCLAGSTLSVGMGQIWYPRQGKRADMKTRMKGHGAVGMLEALSTFSWAGLAFCLQSKLSFAPLALLGIALSAGVTWYLGRSRREEGALV